MMTVNVSEYPPASSAVNLNLMVPSDLGEMDMVLAGLESLLMVAYSEPDITLYDQDLSSAFDGNAVTLNDRWLDEVMYLGEAGRSKSETYTGAFVTYTSTYWTEIDPPLARMANLTRPEE